VFAAACAEPERPLLTQFFALSRLRDLTRLGVISTVVFEPREQGTIATFDIRNVAVRREGGVEVKDVSIVAPVRLPSGRTESQTWIVTLAHKPEGWRVVGLRR